MEAPKFYRRMSTQRGSLRIPEAIPRPAMPNGAPSARVNRVATAAPDLQSGSKMASAGMMQR